MLEAAPEMIHLEQSIKNPEEKSVLCKQSVAFPKPFSNPVIVLFSFVLKKENGRNMIKVGDEM